MINSTRQKLGKKGEQTAALYLMPLGYKIVETNYRTPYGELDLIAELDDLMVFIEVKTRSSASLGNPEISVTLRKQVHIVKSVEYYLQQMDQFTKSCRIDVIAVRYARPDLPPEIVHFENAISLSI